MSAYKRLIHTGGPLDGHDCGMDQLAHDFRIASQPIDGDNWFHRYVKIDEQMKYMGVFNHLAELNVSGDNPARWQDR